MANVALTANVCARLVNPTDYPVLVSRPILRVTNYEELQGPLNIGGFNALYRVDLVDGTGDTSQVVFPLGADFDAPVQDGTVIKIHQMVRIPHGTGSSVVVVYSAEVVGEDYALKLTDMDNELRQLAARLGSETERRHWAEGRLQALLPANLGELTPQALVVQFFEALEQIADINVRTIS